jgi:hypothetical protein
VPRISHPRHRTDGETAEGFVWSDSLARRFERVAAAMREHNLTPEDLVNSSYRAVHHVGPLSNTVFQRIVRYAIKTQHPEAMRILNATPPSQELTKIVDVVVPSLPPMWELEPFDREKVVEAARTIVKVQELIEPIERDIEEAKRMLLELQAKRDELEAQLHEAIMRVRGQ